MISRLCIFLLLLSVVKTTNGQNVICVIPSESENTSSAAGACTGLEVDKIQVQTVTQMDDALLNLNENGNITKLALLPGVHQISTALLLESLSYVSISGQGAAEDVRITCTPDVGLAFVNSRNLIIENVTITGCGLTGERLARVSQVVQEYVVLNTTYELLPNVARAVVIAHCDGLTLENVCIRDTVGVGLTVFNVFGSSLLKNVKFSNNSGSAHTLPSVEDTAGGAMFFFGGSLTPGLNTSDGNTLRIENCNFSNSSSSSKVNRYILADDFFEITDFRNIWSSSSTYPLDGAAGLSLIFSQQYKESHEVTITHSNFTNLHHPEGGCLLVLFQEPLGTSVSVTLDNVVFKKCQGSESGGGLLIGYGYPTNIDMMDLSGNAMPTSQLITVKNTVFRECNANWGGGTAILSIPTFLTRLKSVKHVSFENCTWTQNRGTTGSALAIWEGKYHGAQRKFGFEVDLRSCRFVKNRLEVENTQQLNAAVVSLDAVEVNFYGNTSFLDNKMSCIGATRSIMNINDTFRAEGTQVISSGALDFRDTSFFIVREGATVQFANNEAIWRGGAIFVTARAPWPLTEFGRCFLHFSRFQACPEQPCYTLSSDSENTPPFRMEFINNSAGMVGNEIFGATFRVCPYILPDQNGTEILNYFESELSDILHFSVNITDPESRNTITSVATDVDFNPSTPLPQQVMPGQQWTAKVTATDFYGQGVPLLTTLRFMETGDTKEFSIDGDVVAFIDNEDDELLFEFLGNPGDVVAFQFLPIVSFQPSGNFSLMFRDCQVGFVYNETLHACVCDELLLSLHPSIRCNPNGTISYGQERWIGFRENQNEILYTTSLCIFDYCNESVVLINNLSDSLEQCNFNRTGALCGRCREGYSRVLGSTACLICHNYTLWYLFLYFFSGIVTVMLIFGFQIFISSGYLNGPIFYANVVSIFSERIYPQNVIRYNNVAFVLISFLNLDIGFETCFYDGMTELAYTAIKLAYPFYLLLIISIIAFAAKFCPGRVLKLESLKPVRAIATVLFLSFTTIFQSVTRIVAFAVLTYRGHDTETEEYLWLLDPSVRYGSGGHGVFVAIGFLLFFFIVLPEVLLLLFHKPLRKVKRINKWLQKWWPFFDAFQNPFVGRLRFWIGVQLLMRGLVLMIYCFQQLPSTSSVTLPDYSLFLVIIFLVTFTILQAFLRPYKGWLRNILDVVFLLDLIYLLSTALYFNILRISNQSEIQRLEHLHFKFVEFCQVSAIIVAAFIFLGFILTRLGLVRKFCMKVLPKMPSMVQSTLMAALKDASYKTKERTETTRKTAISVTNPLPTVSTVSLDENESDYGLSVELQTDYSRYRESFLEEEEDETSI